MEMDERGWEHVLHKLVRNGKILESQNDSVKVLARSYPHESCPDSDQTANIEAITSYVDYLLQTSKRGINALVTSKNLRTLTRHLHDNEQNRKIILSGSSLYTWAELDAWRHHPSCIHYRETGQHDMDQPDMAEDEELVKEEALIGVHSHSDSEASERHYYIPSGVNSRHTRSSSDPRQSESRRFITMPSEEIDPAGTRRRQLSAKLHCLYGIPIQEVHRASSSQRYSLRSDTAPVHPYARSRVYDMRQHTDASSWGPFSSDGTYNVDWEKMEAIMLCLHHNMKLFAENREIPNPLTIQKWDVPFVSAAPYSFISGETKLPLEPALPLQAQDPYNITGTWMRIVCFLDYTELFDFNFMGDSPPSNQPRPALDTEEAIRLITMKLVVTKIEPPGEDDGKGLPAVHFKGTSFATRPAYDVNANSKIRGMSDSCLYKPASSLTKFLGRPCQIDTSGRGSLDYLVNISWRGALAKRGDPNRWCSICAWGSGILVRQVCCLLFSISYSLLGCPDSAELTVVLIHQ